MAEHLFWDDDCLHGSIDHVPLPPPPRSLFEYDLFCYEDDLDNILPLADDLPPLPQCPIISSPTRTTLLPTMASPKQLPNVLATPPSPAQSCRSFLDDNCPLRKRVKVTITQPPRKRESPAREQQTDTLPPQTKKRRLSPNPIGQRRLQTTLRLPPGDPTPRLALHIPTIGKSARGSISQSFPLRCDRIEFLCQRYNNVDVSLAT